jgi:hypothetical protein
MGGAPPAVPNATRPTEELRDKAFGSRLVGPDRPALEKALAAAPVRQVPLVVAKVDRLTRSVAFLSRPLDVRFADLPMIEGATGKFLLQQMAGRCRQSSPTDRLRASHCAAWQPQEPPSCAPRSSRPDSSYSRSGLARIRSALPQ